LEMHYSTSPILLSYSFELCAAVRCQWLSTILFF
jgi:hypothetical protein